jgi:restriction system protein
VAKKRGVWAELQRERANRQRLEQQARRAAEQAAVRTARTARQREQIKRASARQAAASERERKRLYIADRKAEAEAMASDLRGRVAELDSVLSAGVCEQAGVSFVSLKHTLEVSVREVMS